MAEIKIKTKNIPMKSLDEFHQFQGNLKKLSKEAKQKLKTSILRNGFNAPIFIWGDFILDGHQRIIAIRELISEGHKLKDNKLPFVEIAADNRKQAAEMILTYNSQYGEITDEGLLQFTDMMEIDPIYVDVIIERWEKLTGNKAVLLNK